MSTILSGSLCLTDILEQAKKGHSSFSKSEKNGKIYFNVLSWLNDTPDQFGNIMSHQLNSKKELAEKEGKIYIGNSKKLESKEPAPLNNKDIEDLNSIDSSDLPF